MIENTINLHKALEGRLKELGKLKEEQRRALSSAASEHQARKKNLQRQKKEVRGKTVIAGSLRSR